MTVRKNMMLLFIVIAALAVGCWRAELVSATGRNVPDDGMTRAAARMMAQRAAKLDAQRNLIETVKNVETRGTETIGELMVKSSESKARVEKWARECRVSRTAREADGSISVTIEGDLRKLKALLR